MDTKPKAQGRTYNIKTQEVGSDGHKKWRMLGRVFVRDDGTGGAVYVGEGEEQKMLALFPRDEKPRARGSSGAPALFA